MVSSTENVLIIRYASDMRSAYRFGTLEVRISVIRLYGLIALSPSIRNFGRMDVDGCLGLVLLQHVLVWSDYREATPKYINTGIDELKSARAGKEGIIVSFTCPGFPRYPV